MHSKVNLKKVQILSSYLYYAVNFLRLSLNLDEIEKFCFLSDAAGSQDRNWTLVKFCVHISILLEIKIIHIFPIRGHSYVCDTNFAMVSNKLRKKPVLETPNDYLKIIEKI